MINFHSRFIILSIVSVLSFSSCTKDEEKKISKTDPSGLLQIYLTDSRGDYKAVYVDIEEVQVFWNSGSKGGWTSLDDFVPDMYNLLQFSNGKDTLLGSLNLPESKINQLRLTVGQRNFVVFKDNDSVAMSTQVGPDLSGLTLAFGDSIKIDEKLKVVLDFDAARSVVQVGIPRKFKFKPVLRIITDDNNGSISGKILPIGSTSAVQAINGTDTIGTFTDNNGFFLIRGLQSGSFDIYIDPGSLSSLNDTTIPSVSVTNGFDTGLGNIQLK